MLFDFTRNGQTLLIVFHALSYRRFSSCSSPIWWRVAASPAGLQPPARSLGSGYNILRPFHTGTSRYTLPDLVSVQPRLPGCRSVADRGPGVIIQRRDTYACLEDHAKMVICHAIYSCHVATVLADILPSPPVRGQLGNRSGRELPLPTQN